MNLSEYRTEAEEFTSDIDREYYLHYSGQQDEFEIEAIYDRHAGLFSRESVEGLRANGNGLLLEFAVKGLIGRETKEETAELARREAALEIRVDGETMPFREAIVRQSNSPDPERRAAIEAARNAATVADLNPLLRALHERAHALSDELGWRSYREMCEELAGIDLGGLGEQTDAFLDASEPPTGRSSSPSSSDSSVSASTALGAPTSRPSSARPDWTRSFPPSASLDR